VSCTKHLFVKALAPAWAQAIFTTPCVKVAGSVLHDARRMVVRVIFLLLLEDSAVNPSARLREAISPSIQRKWMTIKHISFAIRFLFLLTLSCV
jgi:hypothetical protein